MLGNVKPYMPALSRESKTEYNAVYCGLCKTLGRSYGMISRFLLNYDMAFVAMIYDRLHSTPCRTVQEGCFANPVKKKDILLPTAGTEYAADVLILLAYYKLLDNIYDENFFKKAGCIAVYPYFLMKVNSAKKKHPGLAQLLKQQSENQQAAEKTASDIDSVALATARMTQAILEGCAAGEEGRFTAGQLGFFLGRVIYLVDALCDRDEDKKANKYNFFNTGNTSDEDAKAECFMALGEMAYWYSQLPLEHYKEILDNTIYLSLARKIKFAGQNEEENNGQ